MLDVHTRRIVGWAMGARADQVLASAALEMALGRRRIKNGAIHHSDQGVQYTCKAYQQQLQDAGLIASMSRKGMPYDNAVMESFFSTVKSELREHFDSNGEAKMELFDYIEVFYNQRRRHSTLGQISPAAYERRAREEAMDAMENRPDRGFPPRPQPSMYSQREERRPTQTT